MNIILLGAPGSGKGTQSHRLKDEYGLALLTTGDMCRHEAALNTERGREIKLAMESGNLISDELMIAMIKDRILALHNKGFILDGFPRTLPQAKAFDDMLKQTNQTLDHALEIRVDQADLVNRIVGRITCKSCGEVYHIETKPPKQDNVCDKCGSVQLERRSDDQEETLLKRLEVYSNLTAPLIPYYEGKGKLRVIDGNLAVEKVYEQIGMILGPTPELVQKNVRI